MSLIKSGEIHMKADEKRFHRLRLLSQVWSKTNHDEDAVINRALLMGVTKVTAKSYLEAIKRRYP